MLLKFNALVVILFLSFSSYADLQEFKVYSIVDGDTIKVASSFSKPIKVRLAYIDAPEIRQAYGKASKKALSKKISGKTIQCEMLGKDRYGRELAVVYFENRNINLEMVAQGHAWAYRRYTKDKAYYDLEKNAQEQKLGLWSLGKTNKPWHYRKKQREN